MQQNYFVALPRSVPQHNPVSELCRQFLRPHCLVFALSCEAWCVPFKIISNQLNDRWTPIKVYISKIWEAPELNFKCHSKGSEYLCQCDISVFPI